VCGEVCHAMPSRGRYECAAGNGPVLFGLREHKTFVFAYSYFSYQTRHP